MPTVRTTIRPDQPLEVDDTEYAQLKADGLLVEEDQTPEATAAAPATPAKKTTSGPTGSKES
ncbi:hypothetical protein OIE52_39340 [Streptomyces canus]|uniref:hypothetical protein n=1 Tax=Streptomyces canus TaxID=58343 RepID=UPI00324B767D